jgi:beta-galactosidase
MYPPIDLITDFVKYRDDPRPLIMIEYSHAMGNSNGSLADYWQAIESHHGLQGGFIWDWIDQGIEAHTDEGEKYWKYGGDFGDDPCDYDFCLNGLLFPDQSPKPAMAECKQLFAPVKVKPVPGKPFNFVIENKFDFSDLSDLELCWELRTEETALDRGIFTLPNLASGTSGEIALPVSPDVDIMRCLGMVYVHFDFRLKNDAPWAKAGFVIASGERIIREILPLPLIAHNKKTTDISALRNFASLFKPSLFRVPTENDGLKTYGHLRGDPAALFYYKDKALYPWLDLDLLHLRCVDEKTEIEGAKVRYTAALMAGANAAKGFENTRLGTFSSVISEAVDHMVMDIAFDLDPSLPELPKVGISAKIPASFTTIEWFGLGPGESYPDRLTGVFLGNYAQTPAELETPYIVPQENGNRSGVRKINIGDITILPGTPLNMSVSRYTPENLLAARHTSDLIDVSKGENGYYTLNIDCAQRGLGTATCGPDTLEQYRIRPGSFKFRLLISSSTF